MGLMKGILTVATMALAATAVTWYGMDLVMSYQPGGRNKPVEAFYGTVVDTGQCTRYGCAVTVQENVSKRVWNFSNTNPKVKGQPVYVFVYKQDGFERATLSINYLDEVRMRKEGKL
jgi:hypothetical protein